MLVKKNPNWILLNFWKQVKHFKMNLKIIFNGQIITKLVVKRKKKDFTNLNQVFDCLKYY